MWSWETCLALHGNVCETLTFVLFNLGHINDKKDKYKISLIF